MADSIKIAVRVRPFNSREIERDAKCVIEMKDNITTIIKPAVNDQPEERKSFTFDKSYWSHDGYNENDVGFFTPQNNKAPPPYTDQAKVFEDFGTTMLDNSFKGYNTTMLAYGQTGSGKTYSMFGFGPNRGIVPQVCEDIFKRMSANKDPNVSYQLTLSMLEIYQERVRDLLGPDTANNLPVRQHPKLGFYVEGLKSLPVQNYKEIESLMDMGTRKRTMAATTMNATSSRSHSIVTLTFVQQFKADDTEKRSVMNLVDLAGSERADSTGATGKTLKEGSNINSSLSVLGNVIAALVQVQNGKKGVVVPYRDSVLTRLLQNALGGNSKTIMMAALSPADINYEETLSTLRFMDRAKAIKTSAVVNEDPMGKLIRELKEENENLKKRLTDGKGGEDVDGLRSQIADQEKVLAEVSKGWETKLKEAHQALANNETEMLKQRMRSMPYMKNINEDQFLTGMLLLFVPPGEHTIGRKSEDKSVALQLTGLSILARHAVISNSGDKRPGAITIRPYENSAKVRVNGVELTDTIKGVPLKHNARILIGTQHLFLLKLPQDTNGRRLSMAEDREATWLDAQNEIARESGYKKDGTDQMAALYHDISEILPAVRECNAIAEELGEPKQYQMLIKTIRADASEAERKDMIGIKVSDYTMHCKWVMDKAKFMAHRQLVQDMYSAFSLGGDKALSEIPADRDPFTMVPEDWLIGSASVDVKPLLYIIDVADTAMVTGSDGANEGILRIQVEGDFQQNNKKGSQFFGTDPSQLLGKPMSIKITVQQAMGLRWSKGGVYCSYQFWKNSTRRQTKVITSPNPPFNDVCTIRIDSITEEFIEYMKTTPLKINIYGKYDEKIMQQIRSTRVAMLDSRPGTGNAAHRTKSKSGAPGGGRLSRVSEEDAANAKIRYDRAMNNVDRIENEVKAQKTRYDELEHTLSKLNQTMEERAAENKAQQDRLSQQLIDKTRSLAFETQIGAENQAMMADLRGNLTECQVKLDAALKDVKLYQISLGLISNDPPVSVKRSSTVVKPSDPKSKKPAPKGGKSGDKKIAEEVKPEPVQTAVPIQPPSPGSVTESHLQKALELATKRVEELENRLAQIQGDQETAKTLESGRAYQEKLESLVNDLARLIFISGSTEARQDASKLLQNSDEKLKTVRKIQATSNKVYPEGAESQKKGGCVIQ
ncbi:hypothetical protein SmJEL517_g02217 [Synchytrium microbalum]|uniref:Kinesin motor domain-containing protein n=1 Tax=Synchytrium microbalum TaxID=1806994 RepID=A0A507C6M5_9FUNG|nr:uncharacterized protein SmJEL517_g02217 [Synchytrium microbalum]TPX35272.1 hypothetical protein SmJEL517_g02217 [Synchytrium microbalum]